MQKTTYAVEFINAQGKDDIVYLLAATESGAQIRAARQFAQRAMKVEIKRARKA